MNLLIGLFLCLNIACESDVSEKTEGANIVSVSVSGSENNYTFNVGIKSPDTGCKQYADWWEVISEEEELIYRRILAHSHAGEQPFVRSGGKVEIGKQQMVFVRAHMNNSGYGGVVFVGTVIDGFENVDIAEDFASDLESLSPQPSGCAF